MLKPTINVSQDPQFYFTDADYSEYRELVCYERPAAFILHYYFGYTHVRLWLFDRFNFFLNAEGDLDNRTNALESFLRSSGVIKKHSIPFVSDELSSLLTNEITSRSAVIAPYYSNVAGTKIVSSLLIESSGDDILTTSLRGDAFYVQKRIPRESLEPKLYLSNGQLEYFTVHIPDHIIKGATVAAHHQITKFGITEKLSASIESFLNDRSSKLVQGADALRAAFRNRLNRSEFWCESVKGGFDNVLLVKFFWPLQFGYQPFLVFLSTLSRQGLLETALPWLDKRGLDKIRADLESIKQLAPVVSNLAILYGKQPNDRFYRSFTDKLGQIIDIYSEVETTLLNSFVRGQK